MVRTHEWPSAVNARCRTMIFVLLVALVSSALCSDSDLDLQPIEKDIDEDRPCPDDCPPPDPNADPICGSDGKVYDSECHMKVSSCGRNVTSVSWSNCRGKHPLCPSFCLSIYDPVCGPDTKIYPNKCMMHRRNCGKNIKEQDMKYCYSRSRQSRRFEPCPTDCLEEYKLVCGTNGQIYMNECFLRMNTCGQNVKVTEMNRCVETPRCPEVCIALYDPVCGSDGRLYLNNCRMIQENCGNRIARMPRSYCMRKAKKS